MRRGFGIDRVPYSWPGFFFFSGYGMSWSVHTHTLVFLIEGLSPLQHWLLIWVGVLLEGMPYLGEFCFLFFFGKQERVPEHPRAFLTKRLTPSLIWVICGFDFCYRFRGHGIPEGPSFLSGCALVNIFRFVLLNKSLTSGE
ncbi:hypothetical protein QBC38DRAFT_66568 [Podospora fimiseda]|uniref:Uncharacterized protein n=1 Tax=Podospora fimiseda TaxID=252190 RepID=A0AAN6YQ00_9PEZI|nr:hypothetical protein QBC38DRAFT_66568 [Podospora fimiseda]